jgi:hypothetical protein
VVESAGPEHRSERHDIDPYREPLEDPIREDDESRAGDDRRHERVCVEDAA